MADVVIIIITQTIYFNNCYNLSRVSSLKKQTRLGLKGYLENHKFFHTSIYQRYTVQYVSESCENIAALIT